MNVKESMSIDALSFTSTEDIDDIIGRAVIIYGGLNPHDGEDLFKHCTSIVVKLESQDDFDDLVSICGTDIDEEMEPIVAESLLRLPEINKYAKTVDDILETTRIWVVFPVEDIILGHITSKENYEKMSTMKDHILLKPNEEFYGDLGRGVYFFDFSNLTGVLNTVSFFKDYDKLYPNTKSLVIILASIETGTDLDLYMCGQSGSHYGYVINSGSINLIVDNDSVTSIECGVDYSCIEEECLRIYEELFGNI